MTLVVSDVWLCRADEPPLPTDSKLQQHGMSIRAKSFALKFYRAEVLIAAQPGTKVQVKYTMAAEVSKGLDSKSIAESDKNEIRAFRKVKRLA